MLPVDVLVVFDVALFEVDVVDAVVEPVLVFVPLVPVLALVLLLALPDSEVMAEPSACTKLNSACPGFCVLPLALLDAVLPGVGGVTPLCDKA